MQDYDRDHYSHLPLFQHQRFLGSRLRRLSDALIRVAPQGRKENDDGQERNKSDDRQLNIDELNVVAGGKSCAAGRHFDEATVTTRSGDGIISSIQTFVKTYFGR